MRAVGGHGLPDVTLVADPGVPVVVVTPGFCPLGQRHRRRRHHGPAAARQAREHAVAVPGGTGRQAVLKGGKLPLPGRLGGLPGDVGGHRFGTQRLVRQLQDEVVPFARGDRHCQLQAPVGSDLRFAAAGPAQVQRAGTPGPGGAVLEVRHLVAAEPGPHVQLNPDAGRDAGCLDPAQQHRGPGVTGVGQRLPALDDALAGDPAAAPDQRPVLVVAAPHEAGVGRGDGVAPAAPDQGGESGVRMPPGGAHPGDVAARPDQRPPLPVGQQRVLAQDMRGVLSRETLITH